MNSSFNLLFLVGFLGISIVSLTGAGIGAAFIGKALRIFCCPQREYHQRTIFIEKIIRFFWIFLGGFLFYSTCEMFAGLWFSLFFEILDHFLYSYKISKEFSQVILAILPIFSLIVPLFFGLIWGIIYPEKLPF